jgi:hypothetical protein
MQTLRIFYRISSLAASSDAGKHHQSIVVAMGTPDAKRILAEQHGIAAHHITIEKQAPINHGDAYQIRNTEPQ